MLDGAQLTQDLFIGGKPIQPKVMRVVESFVAVPGTYSSEAPRVVAGVTYLGDNAKACRELGYSVRPLTEGLNLRPG